MGRVTAVLCGAFDPATDDAIYDVRELVRAAGIELPPRPPHRPHLTFAAARVESGPELDRVLGVAAEVAGRHRAVPVNLGTVGRFGRAGALWLGADPTPALVNLQQDAAASLEAAGWPAAFAERSAAGRWVAHCTLATRVPKPQLRAVQAVLTAQYRPIAGRVDGVATILVGGRGDVGLVRLAS
jgi:2'-5' RNA ligase